MSAGAAFDVQAQRAVGVARTIHSGVAAEHAGAAGFERKGVLAKADARLGVAQQRQVGPEPQVVAGQQELAANARGAPGVVQRYVQAQLQLDGRLVGAGCAGLGQRTVDPAAHRRGVHEAQGIVEAAAAHALEIEHRPLGEVLDAAAHACELEAAAAHAWQSALRIAQHHGLLVEHQLAAHVCEHRPGALGLARAFVFARRRAWQVSELHAFHQRCDTKFARLLGERKVLQLAFDLEVHTARFARLDCVLHVAAHRRTQRQRQVARHARGVGVIQTTAELERAERAGAAVGRRGAGGPGGLERGLCIRVGQAGVARAHFELRRAARAGRSDAPAQAAVEPLDRHARLFEHAWEIERAAVQRHARLAAGFGRLEGHIGTAQAGLPERRRRWLALGRCRARRRRKRGDRQAMKLRLQEVAQRVPQRPLEAAFDGAGDAFGRQAEKPLAQARLEPGFGQARRQFGQQRQVQTRRAQLAAHQSAVGVEPPAQARIARRPVQAVGGGKAQLPQLELAAGRRSRRIGEAGGDHAAAGRCQRAAAQGEAAVDVRQGERRAGRGRRQCHVGQGEVGGDRRPAPVLQVDPGAQRAVASARCQRRQRQLRSERRQIDRRRFGVERAAPAPPVARARQHAARLARRRTRQQGLPELADCREALAPGRRRRGREPELMLKTAVAQHQFDVAELVLRAAAQFVLPAQRAGAHHQLRLTEEPVGAAARLRAARLCQGDPGDVDPPAGVAPHRQARPVHHQLRKLQLPGAVPARQQGAKRERGAHQG